MGDAAGLVETAKPSLAARHASLLGRASQLVEVERLIARQRDELFHDGVVALTHAFYVIWLRFTFGLWISVRDVLAVEKRKRKASPVGGSSSRLDADDDAGFEAALCTMPIPVSPDAYFATPPRPKPPLALGGGQPARLRRRLAIRWRRLAAGACGAACASRDHERCAPQVEAVSGRAAREHGVRLTRCRSACARMIPPTECSAR